MSSDSLVWFLAGIGVGLAVAMLAFLLMSIADRRALSRQREARRAEVPAPQQVPQAIRLADLDASPFDRDADRPARPRLTPRERDRKLEPQLGAQSHQEPDFGVFAEPSRSGGQSSREQELVFDLTDLPEVTTPTVVDAYVPSFEPPLEAPAPNARLPERQSTPESAEPELTAPDKPAAPIAAAEQQPAPVDESAPERPAIRRPAPPPRPLPAAARTKPQAQPDAQNPVPPSAPARPAPISIAPLKSAVARTSGDGSKAPANFRPLLPKTDGVARPTRPIQRRPFTEITVPFEGPAVLSEAAADRPVADARPVEASSVTVAAPQVQAASPIPQNEVTEPVVMSVAEPIAAGPVTEPSVGPAPQTAAPEPAPGPSPAPALAADEAELDNAAAAAIEMGSGGATSDRAASARPSKALPKMPPPRLTPDTVEAIFAEAFARGSAEPPERKS